MNNQRAAGASSGRRRRIGALRAAGIGSIAVVSVALAACSSSGGTQPSSSSPSGSSGGAAPTGEPIKVGTIQTASGAFGQEIFMKISKVWESWTNAHGGINGHPVKLYALDDGTDAARALTDTKELIDQDHVVAIIGSNSTGAPTIEKYASANGVPIIGGVTAQTAPGKVSFPAATSFDYQINATLAIVKAAGLTKLGRFSCVESPACSQGNAAMAKAAEQVGIKMVDSEKVSSTAPDYTSPCLSMIHSGAQIVSYATSPQIALKIMQTCNQQGAKFASTVNSGTALPSWAKDKSLNGIKIYIMDDVWPLSMKDTTAQRDFFAAIQQYSPGMLSDPEMGAYVQSAWVGMQMFATAAKAGKIGPSSSPADMVTALYSVKDEDLDGLTGPVTYSSGDAHPAKCYFTTLLKSGAYSSPFGTSAKCLD